MLKEIIICLNTHWQTLWSTLEVAQVTDTQSLTISPS